MEQYKDFISTSSIWVSSTPTPVNASFPFYSTEAGHFFTKNGYSISRKYHDSFLLLYSISGMGSIQTMGETLTLSPGQALLMDCHMPHCYFCSTPYWEFLWIHIQGNGSSPLFSLLYPSGIHTILLQHPDFFCQTMSRLFVQVKNSTIQNAAHTSLAIHTLFTHLFSSLEDEMVQQKQKHIQDVNRTIQLIQNQYHLPLTIDDMIQQIPVSKYHFIRIFRQIMGITPYQYLIHYRINQSKQLLRQSILSVSAIASACGFMDSSNFISQFKKHVGQTPSQYQKDFRSSKMHE